MTEIRPTADHRAAEVASTIPRDVDGPVFQETWQAQAFAIVIALGEQRVFTWKEWAVTLGEEIKRAQAAGDPDTGDTYYHHLLAALERTMTQKGITTRMMLKRYYDGWEAAAARTPHGKPIMLMSYDMVK